MFDVSRRGITDLSSMFSQKTSLYEDPNAENGYGQSGSGGRGSYQGQASNDSYQSGYQANDQSDIFGDFESKPARSSSKQSPPQSAPSEGRARPKENTSLLTGGPAAISKEEQLLGQLQAKPIAKKKLPKTNAEDDAWSFLNETAPPKKSASSRRK